VFALRDGDEAVENILDRIFLQHETEHAEIERAIKGFLLLEHRENNDTRSGPFVLQLPRNLESRQSGQIDIEDGDIGLLAADKLQCAWTVASFTDKIETRVVFHELAQSLSKQRMVIDDQDSDAAGHDEMKRAPFYGGDEYELAGSPVAADYNSASSGKEMINSMRVPRPGAESMCNSA